MAQDGETPLHLAASSGHEAAIKALVAAKADVHAKAMVRGGVLGGRGGAASGLYFTIAVRSFGPAVLEIPNPSTSTSTPKPWTLHPSAFDVRA